MAIRPYRAALEECLRDLERGAAAAACAAGSAATGAVFQSLTSGDHVIVPDDCYQGTSALLRDVFERWDLKVSFMDFTDPRQVEGAVRSETKLIWVETPSNPLLKITDIERISATAHEIGALCVCDNTWTTPLLQRPFDGGADLVVHSTTKYLGGHSDVTGGVVVTRDEGEFFQRIRSVQSRYGAIPSLFDSWLVLRGVRTLHLRMSAHSESAMKIATFLSRHESVKAVHYPGLDGHPGNEIAGRQMMAFGGMLSVQVHGGREQATGIAARARLFTRATSLGGTKSLIEHQASIEGPGTKTPENLLRLSIGLENVSDLIDDLAQALDG